MTNLLPANATEAFDGFIKDDDDAPSDCHNHCDHFWGR